jgi:hypothetical protein
MNTYRRVEGKLLRTLTKDMWDCRRASGNFEFASERPNLPPSAQTDTARR